MKFRGDKIKIGYVPRIIMDFIDRKIIDSAFIVYFLMLNIFHQLRRTSINFPSHMSMIFLITYSSNG